MQLLWEPRSVQWKIAILIIALVFDVSCIRNGNGDEQQISVKLKNFFPSEQIAEGQNPTETSARVTSGGGFRPSQMLDFTPSDVMPQGGFNRYPPSYLEPNYRHEVPNSLGQQAASDKQFSFPQESHPVFQSTPLPTTPVVSYLDPYTQQNYRYTPTPPSIIQYQREQPAQDDQVYTVQSSLLVGNHQQNHQRPGHVEDVYLKRPGYVFDESPAPSYRRPTRPPPSLPPPPTTASHKISYDSHDYPPPSYAAEQTSNFVPQQPKQRPLYQRQDTNANRGGGGGAGVGGAGDVGGPPSKGSSNYANNFDNYSQRPNPQQAQIQHPNQIQPQFSNYQYNPQNGGPGGLAGGAGGPGSGLPQRPRPGHNYYEYQIGEIPPPQSQHFQQPQQQFNYRPATQSPGGGGGSGGGVGGGLATLASLYAPQFTNLLLGGGGSSSPSASSQSASPLGSLLGAFTGTQGAGQQSGGLGGGRPPNTQLIRALENIARNDDLQCVPKVLCQMIAGQTLRGQLPGFVTSPAITNFLAGFPVASPALIYGRAALLGLSGGERSCIQTYAKCPKNDMEIIHYLNNHRGGFFKFFSEPEEAPVASQQSDGGSGSLFSILSALTGGGGGGGGQSYTTPRPVPRPTQRPSTDIASGIGSFFTQVLSEYLNGVEYQRRRRRRSLNMDDDFHDEEDNLDTQTSQLVKFQDDEEEEAAKAHTELIGVLQFPEDEGEGRVINFKDIQSEEQHEEGAVRFPDATPADVIRDFNRDAAQRKLKFPQDQDEPSANVRKAKDLSFMDGWKVVLPNGLSQSDLGVDKRRGKRIVFRDTNEHLDDQRLQEEQFREAELREERILEEQLREQQIREEIRQQYVREEELRNDLIREEELRQDRIRKEQLQIQVIRETQNNQQSFKEDTPPPNAVYEDAAPPQRGARVIFPDHYEQHIRKGKILNRPTYAPTYEYNEVGEAKEDRLVVSDEHRPHNHYRLEGGFNSLNYGEYMPGNMIRFENPTSDRPHYNYPNANYISDNRYGSGQNQKPQYEDDNNIYVTNSQGVNEYYIRPDGSKVYLKTG
nr:uncharacterized protein LOC108019418 [Drosophila suzukii]XP_036672149.1 uncharacterized protein LOC108019418 [Drosophila suzukii]